jgi:hypothetical protein
VKHLARSIPLKIETLKERYEIELRWQLGIEMIALSNILSGSSGVAS